MPDSAASELRVTGRAWVFPDADINTDLLMPAHVFGKALDVQLAAVLESLRPGWSGEVVQGDVMVVGRNFGTGSGRPAPNLLKALGVRAIVADSINDLFFRNAVNSGLPVIVAPDASKSVVEGTTITVDARTGVVTDQDGGMVVAGGALPSFLCSIIERGGLLQALREDGYIE